MLVLSRKATESIRIGDDIQIVINRISGNRVTIGVEAPKDVRILRGEVEVDLDDEKQSHDVIAALGNMLAPTQPSFATT